MAQGLEILVYFKAAGYDYFKQCKKLTNKRVWHLDLQTPDVHSSEYSAL
jgi:hypothetical protein